MTTSLPYVPPAPTEETSRNRHPHTTTDHHHHHLDHEVRRMTLNDDTALPPDISPPSPVRRHPRSRRLLSQQQPVRYSFADSDEDENPGRGENEDDPIAWALASRSGINQSKIVRCN